MTRNHAYQLRAMIEKAAVSLDDTDALEAVELYPVWAVGVFYEADLRLRYAAKLYKVLQPHTSQADWTPDVATSLYSEVAEQGAGTIDNPIAYNGNMALENGKYYTQDGVEYFCFRDTGVPVYNPLSALVGIYVEVV